jgi:hypothetical protein
MSTKSNRSSGTQHTQRGVNQGNVLVDPVSGLPITVITDEEGKKRLAVDANVTATIGDINLDLNGVGPTGDTVAIVDNITGNKQKIEADGSINVNMESDAQDGDNIAIGNTWKKAIDQPDANTTYIGLANPGTLTSSSNWQIKRITTSGTQTFIEFAGSDLSFTKKWDDRASLSYG